MIEINHISKRFGKTNVLTDVSAQLQPGCIYGLVGPNGCGKTTLMRCICGFVKPDEGFVRVGEKVVGKDCDFAPSVGILIETPGFLSHLNAFQNLSILAGISGRASSARIREVIAQVGLDLAERKPVGKYSLGMRQRLGIAQSMLENPDALLWDEPFNGLDAQGIAEIHQLLQSQKAAQKTILLVSHSEADIAKACDHVFHMAHGQLN